MLMKAKHPGQQQNAACTRIVPSVQVALLERPPHEGACPEEGTRGWVMPWGAGRAVPIASLGAMQGGSAGSAALTPQRDCSSRRPLCRRMSHLGEGNC